MTDRAWTPEEVRSRLKTLIEESYGTFDSRIVTKVCRKAGIERTTLAGYFGLIKKRRQTERLQEETLRKVLLALSKNPTDLLNACGSVQLDMWPAAVDGKQSPHFVEGSVHLRSFAGILEQVPSAARIKAARNSISAGIASLADLGEVVPAEAYELLQQLDALNREVRQLKLLA